jgi:hypothetical protein
LQKITNYKVGVSFSGITFILNFVKNWPSGSEVEMGGGGGIDMVIS